MSTRRNDRILDTPNLDGCIGKTLQSGRTKEPLPYNGFRRWTQAMPYPDLLRYDAIAGFELPRKNSDSPLGDGAQESGE
ncbi:hypothetical protein [Novosphingobium sp. M1R2S20]|uniref:Uncharacterized protein n=1 Tax=Novosphingobium rhizovicinum TaxID=3228928 RepID=A0ABV3RBH8_9SPHN